MFTNKEPSVVFNGLAELVRLIIPVLILFGFIKWSGEQVAGVMAVVGFSATFLATLFARSQTVPTETANQQIQVAVDQPAGTSVEKIIAMTKARNE